MNVLCKVDKNVRERMSRLHSEAEATAAQNR